MPRPTGSTIPAELVERRIRVCRDRKVMLDVDLAILYGVETKALVQAVTRNADRFPPDFMWRLTRSEFANLRSQFVTSRSHGGRRYAPYAFTELGVAMLSSVLRSRRAIEVNIAIMRAFVRLRQSFVAHDELTSKLARLEAKYDARFRSVFAAIRDLMTPRRSQRRMPIGFRAPVVDGEEDRPRLRVLQPKQ